MIGWRNGMAARLPVVIAQNNLRAGNYADFEEGLVAELIFANGLDVSLIQSLERVPAGSTDHLCLEGFMGSFACLSWSTPDEAAQEFARLGIAGSISCREPQELGREIRIGDLGNPKKILHLDLRQWDSPSAVMVKLNEILADRNVQVIPIMLSPKKEPSPKTVQLASPTPRVHEENPSEKKKSNEGDEATWNGSGAASSQDTPLTSAKTATKIELNDDEEWPHLDRLFDDLDSSLI